MRKFTPEERAELEKQYEYAVIRIAEIKQNPSVEIAGMAENGYSITMEYVERLAKMSRDELMAILEASYIKFDEELQKHYTMKDGVSNTNI